VLSTYRRIIAARAATKLMRATRIHATPAPSGAGDLLLSGESDDMAAELSDRRTMAVLGLLGIVLVLVLAPAMVVGVSILARQNP
jgi:hypothetical protein